MDSFKSGWQASNTICRSVFAVQRPRFQNSRLSLSREVELLKEQERFVHFGLSNAIAEAKRAQENLDLQHKRLEAIVQQLDAIESSQDSERAELDVTVGNSPPAPGCSLAIPSSRS